MKVEQKMMRGNQVSTTIDNIRQVLTTAMNSDTPPLLPLNGSDRVRALNLSLDAQLLRLQRDEARLAEKLKEHDRVQEQLRALTTAITKLTTVISCRKRDVENLFAELPLTQASPEQTDPCQEAEEEEERDFLTQDFSATREQ